MDLKRSTPQGDLENQGLKMAKAMFLRGPDAQQVWAEAENGISLAHARLSIIDLSDAGLQPMTSHNERYIIVYNGEIYNSAEILDELGPDKPPLKGYSDTEAILEACAVWGVEKTVSKLIGMFAFALWDRKEKKLNLVRDRFGIKPLYYGEIGGHFLFGSELKAFREHSAFKSEIDRNALSSYMRFSYVPAPHSIFKNVKKLKPGHILVFDENHKVSEKQFWNLRDIAIQGNANPSDLSYHEAEDFLDGLIKDAVKKRMVADVPLGTFLSGGIDSSLVVSAAQVQSTERVKTFTIGFSHNDYDESTYAAQIAKHLGTDHTELILNPDQAMEVIPDLPDYYDEPFADSSQIPTFLVSKLARQSVTVSLSGDGGDELFAGYERHKWAETIWQKTGWLPRPLAGALGSTLKAMPNQTWQMGNHILPARYKMTHPDLKIAKLANILNADDPIALYRRLVTSWDQPDDYVINGSEYHGLEWDHTVSKGLNGTMETMQVMDALTYLPDDILHKVDRASMAVSLEARVPLLDHRIAEFAFSLPRHYRFDQGQGKRILRSILSRYVPDHLFERPKMGFGIPVGEWLRGPLRAWAEDLLSEQALNTGNYFKSEKIRAIWMHHLNGTGKDYTSQIWTVLMFQAWKKKWGL